MRVFLFNMKIQNLIATAIIGCIPLVAPFASASPTGPETYYEYNKYVDGVYVGIVKVHHTSPETTTITAPLLLPLCENGTRLIGVLNFSFESNGQSFEFFGYSVVGKEGQIVDATINMEKFRSTIGKVGISAKWKCFNFELI